MMFEALGTVLGAVANATAPRPTSYFERQDVKEAFDRLRDELDYEKSMVVALKKEHRALFLETCAFIAAEHMADALLREADPGSPWFTPKDHFDNLIKETRQRAGEAQSYDEAVKIAKELGKRYAAVQRPASAPPAPQIQLAAAFKLNKSLNAENQALKQQLEQANKQIEQLRASNQQLRADLVDHRCEKVGYRTALRNLCPAHPILRDVDQRAALVRAGAVTEHIERTAPSGKFKSSWAALDATVTEYVDVNMHPVPPTIGEQSLQKAMLDTDARLLRVVEESEERRQTIRQLNHAVESLEVDLVNWRTYARCFRAELQRLHPTHPLVANPELRAALVRVASVAFTLSAHDSRWATMDQSVIERMLEALADYPAMERINTLAEQPPASADMARQLIEAEMEMVIQSPELEPEQVYEPTDEELNEVRYWGAPADFDPKNPDQVDPTVEMPEPKLRF